MISAASMKAALFLSIIFSHFNFISGVPPCKETFPGVFGELVDYIVEYQIKLDALMYIRQIKNGSSVS